MKKTKPTELDYGRMLERVNDLAMGIHVFDHKQRTAYNYLARVLEEKIKEKSK